MAYFILYKQKVIKQYNILQKYVDLVAYNYKVNAPVGKVLEKQTNAFFSLSSLQGIENIEDKYRLIYILQGENKEEIKQIYRKKVNKFVVDNKNDLKKVMALKNTDIYLRMKFKEHTLYTGKYFVYGFNWEEANKIIPKIFKNTKRKVNIHFHRKTQNIGEWNLIEDFSQAIYKKNLNKIGIVNIGGGLPIKYVNSKPDIKQILKNIKAFKKYLNEKDIKLMVEPGRFIAGPSIDLVAEIKNIYNNNIILDCSIYNAYMDTFLFNIRLEVKGEGKGKQTYLLKGNSPDSLDIFRYKVRLSKKKIGNNIVFKNAGAYNFYTEFNSMPKLKTIIK